MAGRPRTGKVVPCGWCGKEVYAPPNRLKRAAVVYCSDPCRSSGRRRQRTVVCETCGIEFEAPIRQTGRRFCGKRCEGIARSTTSTGRWHNNKPVRISDSGYPLIYEPTHPRAYKDGWVLEHRWLVEQDLGRVLTPDEHVHHKDGNRQNNDLTNLEVLSPSEHAILTNREVREALAELAEYRKRYGPLEP